MSDGFEQVGLLVEICRREIDSLGLGEEYIRKLEEESDDLKRYSLFLQTDKASEILSKAGAKIPSNKSGSVILFLCGASSVDPLRGGISPSIKKYGKADPPDIDIDLHPEVRDPIKAFLTERFGSEHVCSVGTVGTYKTKNVILDVARALGVDLSETMSVTKNLDASIGEGDDETKLDKAGFDEICLLQPALAEYFDKYPDVRVHAEVLRNQAKNYGTHAGGVIISNNNLVDNIPVFLDKSGRVVSAWAESGDKSELSSVGYIKFDILGLCLDENTLIETEMGPVKIKDIEGLGLFCLDDQGKRVLVGRDDYEVFPSGQKEVVEIEFEDGSVVVASPEHIFFQISGEV